MDEDHEGDPDSKDPKCPNCSGNGWIVLLVSRVRCRACKGTGFLNGDDGLEFDDKDTLVRAPKKRP